MDSHVLLSETLPFEPPQLRKMNASAATSTTPEMSLPPRFADFKFNFIGQQPQLLNRMSTDSTPNFRASPTPSHMELEYPSPSITPCPPSRPSLLQMLDTTKPSENSVPPLYIPRDLEDRMSVDRKPIISPEETLSQHFFQSESLHIATSPETFEPSTALNSLDPPVPKLASWGLQATPPSRATTLVRKDLSPNATSSIISSPLPPAMPTGLSLTDKKSPIQQRFTSPPSVQHMMEIQSAWDQSYDSALLAFERAERSLSMAQEMYDAAKAALIAAMTARAHSIAAAAPNSNQDLTQIGRENERMTFDNIDAMMSDKNLDQRNDTTILESRSERHHPHPYTKSLSRRIIELEQAADAERQAWSLQRDSKTPTAEADLTLRFERLARSHDVEGTEDDLPRTTSHQASVGSSSSTQIIPQASDDLVINPTSLRSSTPHQDARQLLSSPLQEKRHTSRDKENTYEGKQHDRQHIARSDAAIHSSSTAYPRHSSRSRSPSTTSLPHHATSLSSTTQDQEASLRSPLRTSPGDMELADDDTDYVSRAKLVRMSSPQPQSDDDEPDVKPPPPNKPSYLENQGKGLWLRVKKEESNDDDGWILGQNVDGDRNRSKSISLSIGGDSGDGLDGKKDNIAEGESRPESQSPVPSGVRSSQVNSPGLSPVEDAGQAQETIDKASRNKKHTPNVGKGTVHGDSVGGLGASASPHTRGKGESSQGDAPTQAHHTPRNLERAIITQTEEQTSSNDKPPYFGINPLDAPLSVLTRKFHRPNYGEPPRSPADWSAPFPTSLRSSPPRRFNRPAHGELQVDSNVTPEMSAQNVLGKRRRFDDHPPVSAPVSHTPWYKRGPALDRHNPAMTSSRNNSLESRITDASSTFNTTIQHAGPPSPNRRTFGGYDKYAPPTRGYDNRFVSRKYMHDEERSGSPLDGSKETRRGPEVRLGSHRLARNRPKDRQIPTEPSGEGWNRWPRRNEADSPKPRAENPNRGMSLADRLRDP